MVFLVIFRAWLCLLPFREVSRFILPSPFMVQKESMTGLLFQVRYYLTLSSDHFSTDVIYVITLCLVQSRKLQKCCLLLSLYIDAKDKVNGIYVYAGTVFKNLHTNPNHHTQMSPTTTEQDLINITSCWHTMYHYNRNHKQGPRRSQILNVIKEDIISKEFPLHFLN